MAPEYYHISIFDDFFIISEAEVLETYNRRENLRVVGIECETEYKQNEVTETKVLDLAKKIEVTMSSSDISIAHRLPTNKP